MLWDESVLKDYAIQASDGRLGTVSDFLFEDSSWVIRWLVADTGNWLSGRKVLLPLSALGLPDSTQRQFPVKLTMQQVKDRSARRLPSLPSGVSIVWTAPPCTPPSSRGSRRVEWPKTT